MIPPRESVRVAGRGPTIILVHGTAGNRSSFGTLPWLLRDRLRVVRYDRRGTGDWPLEKDAPAPSVAEHAADLADLARTFDGDPVFVFGTSFGSAVALEMLRSRPRAVAGAILHEPAMPTPLEPGSAAPSPVATEFRRLSSAGRAREAAERFLARLVPGGGAVASGREARAMALGGSPDWRAVYRDLAAAVDWQPSIDGLRVIDVRVLLLDGDRSGPATRASVESLSRILPLAGRETLAGAAHVLAGDATWGRVAEIVLSFVDARARL